jgi:hypothetical protein
MILITKKSILFKKPPENIKNQEKSANANFWETCLNMFWVNKASKGKVAVIRDKYDLIG